MGSSRHPHNAPSSVTATRALPSVEKLRRRIQRAKKDGHPNKAERLQMRLDALLQPKKPKTPTHAQVILAPPVPEPELWERVEFDPITDEPNIEVTIVPGRIVNPTDEPDYCEVINSLPLPVMPEEDDPYSELQDSSPEALLQALETLAATIRAFPGTLPVGILDLIVEDTWPAFASKPMADVPASNHIAAIKAVSHEIDRYLAQATPSKGRYAALARASLVSLRTTLIEHLPDHIVAA